MIDEEEGDGEIAYKELIIGLSQINNDELIPVKNAASRIKKYKESSESISELDYLVYYY
jgi:hypothetical protein